MFEGDFSSHQFEQEDIVHRLERVTVSQGQFKLGCVIFRIDAFNRQTASVGNLHDFINQSHGVNGWTRAVNVSTRRVPFCPTTLPIGLHHKRLEFDADFGSVTLLLPGSDCSPERMSR